MTEWENQFEALVHFQKEYGHVQVPRRYPPRPGLFHWLAAQKTELDRLASAQARRLWELGVRFPGWENAWLTHFFKLEDGKTKYGSANDERIFTGDEALQTWRKLQQGWREDLSAHRRRWLEEIGFDWGISRLPWETHFAKAVNFQTQHGHCWVPAGWPEDPNLAEWLAFQWRSLKNPAKKKRLREAGLLMSPDDRIWGKHFKDWSDYVREFGTYSFPGDDEAHRDIAKWTRWQRLRRRRGKLSAERIRRLDEAGFPWNPKADLWEAHFRQLERFQEIHGHCRVGEVEGRSDLAAWCWDQIRHHKLGEVPAERVVRLDALGFVWNPRQEFTDRMLERMKAFHAEHGHGRVPLGRNGDLRLVQWIARQRSARKKGLLSPERIAELDGLFEWEPGDNPKKWERYFSELEAFKRSHGHCEVGKVAGGSKLGRWCNSQKSQHRRGLLEPGRTARLDSLGFVWETRQATFEDMLEKFRAFRARHGHGRVPERGSNADPQLHSWIVRQRKARRKGTLSSTRLAQLTEIGFDWGASADVS